MVSNNAIVLLFAIFLNNKGNFAISIDEENNDEQWESANIKNEAWSYEKVGGDITTMFKLVRSCF